MKKWLRSWGIIWKSREKSKKLSHEKILTNCIEARMRICQILLDHAKVSDDSENYNRYKTMLNDAKKDYMLIPITIMKYEHGMKYPRLYDLRRLDL